MEHDLGSDSTGGLGAPPRTGLAPPCWLRRRSPPLWAAAVLALLISACRIEQEIRFNADGSGTASVTVGIEEQCLTGPMECSEKAKRLLGGEGPVAQAKADAESLPFDVRVVPFDRPGESGYTLSFDFSSLEDLEQKLAPDPATGRSQTSAFDFSGMTFEANGDGGFTFTAGSVPSRPRTVGGAVFTIVLPGAEGEHNADIAEDTESGTRFQWRHMDVPGQQLQASTCSPGSCPGSSTPILVGLAVAVMAAAVFAFALRRRQRDERGLRGPGHVA